jgi:Cro/C1-type HTH DNA-binding domain
MRPRGARVHRPVSGAPERLPLAVLAALCDILEVTPAELIATKADNVAPRNTAAGTGPTVVDVAATAGGRVLRDVMVTACGAEVAAGHRGPFGGI